MGLKFVAVCKAFALVAAVVVGVHLLHRLESWRMVNDEINVTNGEQYTLEALANDLRTENNAAQRSTIDTLTKESPTEQSPTEQSPTEQSPIEHTPTEQSPIEHTPTEQSPIEHTPIEQSPIEQTPTPTPIEQIPTQHSPQPLPTLSPSHPHSISRLLTGGHGSHGGHSSHGHENGNMIQNSDFETYTIPEGQSSSEVDGFQSEIAAASVKPWVITRAKITYPPKSWPSIPGINKVCQLFTESLLSTKDKVVSSIQQPVSLQFDAYYKLTFTWMVSGVDQRGEIHLNGYPLLYLVANYVKQMSFGPITTTLVYQHRKNSMLPEKEISIGFKLLDKALTRGGSSHGISIGGFQMHKLGEKEFKMVKERVGRLKGDKKSERVQNPNFGSMMLTNIITYWKGTFTVGELPQGLTIIPREVTEEEAGTANAGEIEAEDKDVLEDYPDSDDEDEPLKEKSEYGGKGSHSYDTRSKKTASASPSTSTLGSNLRVAFLDKTPDKVLKQKIPKLMIGCMYKATVTIVTTSENLGTSMKVKIAHKTRVHSLKANPTPNTAEAIVIFFIAPKDEVLIEFVSLGGPETAIKGLGVRLSVVLEQVGLLGHVAANKEAKKRKGSGGAEGSGSWEGEESKKGKGKIKGAKKTKINKLL